MSRSIRAARRLAFAAAVAGAVAATPAYADGTQPFDTSVAVQCTDVSGPTPRPVRAGIVRISGEISATTSEGETAWMRNPVATLRLTAPGPAGSTLEGKFSSLSVLAGSGATPTELTFSNNGWLATTARTGDGYGPFALPISHLGTGLRTPDSAGTSFRLGSITLRTEIVAPGATPLYETPYSRCDPAAGADTLLGTVPNQPGAPKPPTITAASPATGPLSGGTTVTLRGSGFAAGGTPTVSLASTGDATDVTVIDDATLTFKTPFSWSPGASRILVEVAGRTPVWIYDDPTAPTFTYVEAAPLPTVSYLTPTSTKAGIGATLHFVVGENLGAVRFVKVGTKSVKPLIVLTPQIAIFEAPAQAAGTYRVSLTTKDGLSASTPSTLRYR